MTITKAPLSLTEKKTLKRAFNIRMKLGLFFVIPVLFGSAAIWLDSIIEFNLNEAWAFIFCTGFFLLCLYLFFKFVVPFYRQTIKNIKANNKLIIETVITDIKTNWDSELGNTYVIYTESPVPIVSTINCLLNPVFGYKDLRPYMRIRIHCMEDNMMEILYFEPV